MTGEFLRRSSTSSPPRSLTNALRSVASARLFPSSLPGGGNLLSPSGRHPEERGGSLRGTVPMTSTALYGHGGAAPAFHSDKLPLLVNGIPWLSPGREMRRLGGALAERSQEGALRRRAGGASGSLAQ